MKKDLYLAVGYISPENSPMHALYNVVIFPNMENDTSYFQEEGSILVEDFNSRTSNKPDYIENDRILSFADSNQTDTPLPRALMDPGSNRFREYPFDLCKALKMRIVNGRLFKDKSASQVTCTTYNGESVVDY